MFISDAINRDKPFDSTIINIIKMTELLWMIHCNLHKTEVLIVVCLLLDGK